MSQKNKPIIVIGSGGHSKVLLNILVNSDREILGITDPKKEIGENFFGSKVLGNDEEVFKYSSNDIELVNGVAGYNLKKTRNRLTKIFKDKGYSFIRVIHPSAIIADEVTLHEGVQIMAGAIIQPNVIIGHSSIINTGSIVDHDCLVEKECHIAPGVILNGNVSVGEQTHIGTGTSVIQSTKIGNNCFIAAGSIVHKDIPSNSKFLQARKEKSLSLIPK